MAQKEIYRLDIKIGVDGDDETKKKLTATERFAQQSEKKLKALDKIKASPSVRLKDKLSSPLEKVKGRLSDFKKTAATEITALIGLGASAKAAMAFEKGMFKANTIAKLSKENLNALSKQTLTLSNDTGVVAKDLAEMEYNALSASVAIEDLTSVVKTSSILSKGGFADANDSLKLLTSTYNVYREEFEKMGVTQSKASEMIADKMITVQNLGVTTVGELSTQLGNITPIAKNANMTLDDLSASMIVLTKNGLGTSEAVTGMKAALSNIIKPSEQAMEMAEALGIQFDTTAIKSKGFGGFLKDLREKLKSTNPALIQAADKVSKYQHMIDGAGKGQKANKALMRQWKEELKSAKDELKVLTKSGGETTGALAQLFGSVEGLGAVLSLTSEYGMKDFQNGLEASKNALGSTKTAADMMGETRAEKFEKAMNKLKNVGIELGIKLLPVVEKVSNIISSLADRFNSLNPATQDFIIKVGVAAVVLKPFAGTISGLTKGIGSLIGMGPKLSGFFGLFGGAKAVKDTTEAVAAAKAASKVSSTVSAVSSIPIYGASGQILKTVTKDAGTASKTVAKTAGTAAKEIGALSLASKAGAILLNPWVLGIGAATIAGYGLYKHLKKEAVPTVDLFADKIEYGSKKIVNTAGEVEYEMTKTTKKISNGTKEAIKAYMDLDRNATQSMTDLYSSSSVVTKQNSKAIIDNFSQMNSQIKRGFDEQYQKRMSSLQGFFNNSKVLSTERQTEILNKEKLINDGRIASQQELFNKINGITQRAINDGRLLRQDELNEIQGYRKLMAQNAVESLSQEEVDCQVIMERLKGYSERITAEQASNAIKQAEERRKSLVSKAEQEFNDLTGIFVRMKNSGSINDKEYDEMVNGASKQLEEATHKAELMKEGVVSNVEKIFPETKECINTTTGEIVKNLDLVSKTWDGWNPSHKTFSFSMIWENARGIFKQLHGGGKEEYKDTGEGHISGRLGYANGTNYATRGIHEVAEHGFEIVIGRQYRLFNGGEKVLNNRKARSFLEGTTEANSKPKVQVAQPALVGISGGSNFNIDVDVENNFDNDVDIDGIVQTAMQEFGYKLKEALRNIKK